MYGRGNFFTLFHTSKKQLSKLVFLIYWFMMVNLSGHNYCGAPYHCTTWKIFGIIRSTIQEPRKICDKIYEDCHTENAIFELFTVHLLCLYLKNRHHPQTKNESEMYYTSFLWHLYHYQEYLCSSCDEGQGQHQEICQ